MIAFVGKHRQAAACSTGCGCDATVPCGNPNCPNREKVFYYMENGSYVELSRAASDRLLDLPPEPKRPNNRHERRRQAALSRRRT